MWHYGTGTQTILLGETFHSQHDPSHAHSQDQHLRMQILSTGWQWCTIALLNLVQNTAAIQHSELAVCDSFPKCFNPLKYRQSAMKFVLVYDRAALSCLPCSSSCWHFSRPVKDLDCELSCVECRHMFFHCHPWDSNGNWRAVQVKSAALQPVEGSPSSKASTL